MPWSPYAGAVVDADFVAGRYYYNGVTYQALNEWLTAVGGTKTGNVITFPWTDNTVAIFTEARKHRPANDEVIYSLDNGTETTAVWARHINSNGQVAPDTINGGTTLLGASRGPYALGATLKLVHSVAPNSHFGTVNGATGSFAVPGNSGLPAVTTCRIGGGPVAGKEWTGDIYRFTLFPDPLPADASAAIALSVPNYRYYVEGDSYSIGSAGVGAGPRLAALTKKQIRVGAVGGSTITQIRDRILAMEAGIRALPTVLWDGDANAYGTVSGYLALYNQAVQALGHSRFVVIPPAIRAGLTTDDQQAYRDITAGLKAAYPNNVVDAMPILIAAADPVADAAQIAAGQVPASLLAGDGIHLIDAGMNPVMAAVYAKIG